MSFNKCHIFCESIHFHLGYIGLSHLGNLMSWYANRSHRVYTPDGFAVFRRGISLVVWRRGPSASPLCLVIIACCPSHPSFNHRRSSFSGRCCPTVEHSATERHVSIVNICFQETLEDPSLQSFFPWISCSAWIFLLTYFGRWKSNQIIYFRQHGP